MAHITLLALEGCFSSASANLVDGFWIANAWHRALCCGEGALFETCIATWDGRPVRGVGNLLVQPDAPLAAVDRTDVRAGSGSVGWRSETFGRRGDPRRTGGRPLRARQRADPDGRAGA